jgi:hypothetical protein
MTDPDKRGCRGNRLQVCRQAAMSASLLPCPLEERERWIEDLGDKMLPVLRHSG